MGFEMPIMDAVKLSSPSLDQPFGIAAWPLFDQLWRQFRSFPADRFRFVPGHTPLSTLTSTVAVLTSYYLIVFGGRLVMKSREPLKLGFLFKLHNFALTAVSFSLLALFVEQMLGTVVRKGIFHAICDESGGWTNELVTLYYVSRLWGLRGSKMGQFAKRSGSSTISPSTSS